jgi:hypothetical protein
MSSMQASKAGDEAYESPVVLQEPKGVRLETCACGCGSSAGSGGGAGGKKQAET